MSVRYVSGGNELGTPDAVILPGTKSTIADLIWLRERGLEAPIRVLASAGAAVVGICGGYQMLGQRICDPARVEASQDEIAGMGLLPVETNFLYNKATYQSSAVILEGAGWRGELQGQTITGYEIHAGRTNSAEPWLTIQRNREAKPLDDGAISADGRIWGCYLHGLFANENLRRAWLGSLGWQPTSEELLTLDAAFDRLADAVEVHPDMNRLTQIVGL